MLEFLIKTSLINVFAVIGMLVVFFWILKKFNKPLNDYIEKLSEKNKKST